MATITVARIDKRLHVKAPFDMRLSLKAIGSRWDPTRKTWHMPATPASAAAIFRIVGLHPHELDNGMAVLLEKSKEIEAAVEHKTAEELDDFPGQTVAWLHQRQAFHFAKQLPASMLALDMGTGKSKVAIGLMEEWDVKVALILCPKAVMGVWPGEIAKHASAPEEWAAIVANPKASVPKRAAEMAREQALAAARGQRIVLICNYEASWRTEMEKLLRGNRYGAIVLDESHRIKAAGGRASLLVARMREDTDHRLCLTGTPMPHSPLDLYAQFRFLDPGVFGTSANKFKHRYAIVGGYENRQVVGWQNEEEMAAKFASLSYVCKADEVLDLPPIQHLEREVTLTPKTIKVYRQLAREFIAEVDGGIVTAANALSKLLRLQQVASGFVKTEEGDEQRISTEKMDMLADILADLVGQPVVVFCRFRADLDAVAAVCAKIGRVFGELSGRMNTAVVDGRLVKDVEVAAVQIQAGGVGIDLTRARYAIYYSLGFSLGDYLQSLKRLHRPGQVWPVVYIHLIANVPVERRLYKVLEQRGEVVDELVAASRSLEI